MPKGFLVKRKEDMSVQDVIPYRPWRSTPPTTTSSDQDEPVDFSIRKGKLSDTSEVEDRVSEKQCPQTEDHSSVYGDKPVDVGSSPVLVRTPDSGFSSPSDGGDFYRRCSVYSTGGGHRLLVPPPLHAAAAPYHEQVAPLSLIKRKDSEDSKSVLSASPSHHSETFLTGPHGFQLTIPRLEDPPYLLGAPPQTSPYHLLSPTLLWPHGNSPLRPPISPLHSPPGSRPFDLTHPNTLIPLRSPQEGLNLTQLHHPLGSPRHVTPSKSPVKSSTPSTSFQGQQKRKSPGSSSVTPDKKPKSMKRAKAVRKLNFDEDKTSPVSGTIIRELAEGEEPLAVRKGDIDPEYNVVEITEEAKTELAKIENRIGDYVCRLCKEMYDDAFGLAQHRCCRIIHVEYRCPECDKVFNCPANLASHRRWHKPKPTSGASTSTTSSPSTSKDSPSKVKSSKESNNNNTSLINNNSIPSLLPLPEFMQGLTRITAEAENDDSNLEDQFECNLCYKKFKRQSYLRKHMATHRLPSEEEPGPSKPPPLTPLLSPPFPNEVLPCHLCAAAFYTPQALQLHLTTSHGHPSGESSPSGSSTLQIPRPHFSPRHGHHHHSLAAVAAAAGGFPSPSSHHHLLQHHPRQISAST
ncbi:unnamed protein product [Meganyctiphanes norvegica]|uniref:C2H2-type domain-containing protein n=1 Tax=Meganyctiphanes norvegica TaxID=48144 RepID=A0AAV2QJT6_MEGNR